MCNLREPSQLAVADLALDAWDSSGNASPSFMREMQVTIPIAVTRTCFAQVERIKQVSDRARGLIQQSTSAAIQEMQRRVTRHIFPTITARCRLCAVLRC